MREDHTEGGTLIELFKQRGGSLLGGESCLVKERRGARTCSLSSLRKVLKGGGAPEGLTGGGGPVWGKNSSIHPEKLRKNQDARFSDRASERQALLGARARKVWGKRFGEWN